MKRTPLRRRSRKLPVSDRQAWSRAVKTRDHGQCQAHGCKHQGRKFRMEAHHVWPKGTYPDLQFMLENGLTLCGECHATWHASSRLWRQWWENRWPQRARKVKNVLDRAKSKRVVSIPSGTVPAEQHTERSEA